MSKSNDLQDLMQKLGKLTESKEKLTKMGIQSQCIIQIGHSKNELEQL